MDKAAEFFLKKVHGLELQGGLQEAVIEYRNKKSSIDSADEEARNRLFEMYHEMLVDLYREEFEHWINENQVIHMSLKNR